MNVKHFIIIAVALAVTGCAADLYDDVGKKLEFPVAVAPMVRSFDAERNIVIEWPADEVTDEYLLYKDELPTGAFLTCIYRGTACSFVDTDIRTLGTICSYYKVARRMGEREFEKSDYSFGVAGNFINDVFEPNNEQERAARLVKSSTANIYYYKDNWGNQLEDIDWYSVTLEGGYFMQIVFKDFLNYENGLLRFALQGDNFTPINTDQNFVIYNYSSATETFYFQVFCNKNSFGNRMVNYTIQIVRIEKF